MLVLIEARLELFQVPPRFLDLLDFLLRPNFLAGAGIGFWEIPQGAVQCDEPFRESLVVIGLVLPLFPLLLSVRRLLLWCIESWSVDRQRGYGEFANLSAPKCGPRAPRREFHLRQSGDRVAKQNDKKND